MRHDVAALDDLPMRMPVAVKIGKLAGVLVRTDDGVVALHDRCAHMGVQLSRGRLQTGLKPSASADDGFRCEGLVLSCPWHGWEFRLDSGRAVWDEDYGVRTWPVTIEDGRVIVETGKSAR